MQKTSGDGWWFLSEHNIKEQTSIYYQKINTPRMLLAISIHKVNDNPNIFILLKLYYYIQLNKTKYLEMINAFIFPIPSKWSTESMKTKVITYAMYWELDSN